jgi:MarR family 2-MHQ and catechol resistance regulon transcriptional repressor
LVKRERINEDRRYLTVTLTEQGGKLIGTVFTAVEAAIVTEMSALAPDEQKLLGGLCKKLGLRAERT